MKLFGEICLIILQAYFATVVATIGFTLLIMMFDHIVLKFLTGHTIIEPWVQRLFS